jgi:hypothetical protein
MNFDLMIIMQTWVEVYLHLEILFSRPGDVAQSVVECLLSMCEVLGLIHRTTHTHTQKTQMKENNFFKFYEN